MIDNATISDFFSLLSKLSDIHGENEFKVKSYANAAFAIDKLASPLTETTPSDMAAFRGIGSSNAQKIIEVIETGKMEALEQLLVNTPSGIIDMLSIKGIGPKKIRTIWKEMEIESLGELLYACQEDRLKRYKGFGEKTQQQVIENIEFFQRNIGRYLYAQVDALLPAYQSWLQDHFPKSPFFIAGEFAQQLEIIDQLCWVTSAGFDEILNCFQDASGYQLKEKLDDHAIWSPPVGPDWKIYFGVDHLTETTIRLSCSDEVWSRLSASQPIHATDEQHWFAQRKLPFFPAFVRDNILQVEKIIAENPSPCIQHADIHGIIHCHSVWSDGKNSLREMAVEAMRKGMEYLIISDHSQSAYYANGLNPERVLQQHEEIDRLNSEMAPFKIYKSIESDILGDGSLDYQPELLHRFDLVIASIHSNLKMSEAKAMLRLLNAVNNPFTSILGHPTGRLLLSRNGYPVNHDALIDACVANQVVIEINAHPSRLDLDWRFIEQALKKNALLSINPDAHQLDGFDDVAYGIKVAQKAWLTPGSNLSSFRLEEMEAFVEMQKKKRR
jgi:DNA polymerase (family 10)